MADGDDVVSTTGVQADTGTDATTDTSATDTTAVVTDDKNSDVTVDAKVDAVADDSAGEGDSGKTDTDADAADGEGSQAAPDTYADFVMPEGIQLDEAVLGEALPLFKELKLNQDQAQKVVDFHTAQVQAGAQKQVDAFNQQKSDWLEQSTNDKEFGGDKFDENVKVAQAAINKFGTPELKQLLDDYGVGNHPEIVRFMFKVGKLTAEDVPGSSTAQQQTTDRVNLLYPNDQNSKS